MINLVISCFMGCGSDATLFVDLLSMFPLRIEISHAAVCVPLWANDGHPPIAGKFSTFPL